MPEKDNLANSDDPDEKPPNVTFYQSLHTLLRIIKSSGTIKQLLLGS